MAAKYMAKLQHLHDYMDTKFNLLYIIKRTVFFSLFIIDESSISLLHSTIADRNVGKSLTLDILSKAQGVNRRHHSLLLAGGDQNKTGTSV